MAMADNEQAAELISHPFNEPPAPSFKFVHCRVVVYGFWLLTRRASSNR